MSEKKSPDNIKEAIRDHYGKAIKLHTENKTSSCCSPQPVEFDKDTAERFAKMAGYNDEQLSDMPENVTSFGCGNPVAFMNVKEGETVLDLGSGSGLDLILASKKVGDTGKVIGLDMTDEMIDVCRSNLEKAGVKNSQVLKGEMEDMPVADSEVDWIISNCVINLSPDKKKVFAEAYRVLKPGGQVMVSDIVTIGMPDEYRDSISAWVGCIAGAVEEDEYIKLMEEAGFVDVKVTGKMVYTGDALSALANDNCGCGPEDELAITIKDVEKYSDRVASVRVYAKKPE